MRGTCHVAYLARKCMNLTQLLRSSECRCACVQILGEPTDEPVEVENDSCSDIVGEQV